MRVEREGLIPFSAIAAAKRKNSSSRPTNRENGTSARIIVRNQNPEAGTNIADALLESSAFSPEIVAVVQLVETGIFLNTTDDFRFLSQLQQNHEHNKPTQKNGSYPLDRELSSEELDVLNQAFTRVHLTYKLVQQPFGVPGNATKQRYALVIVRVIY